MDNCPFQKIDNPKLNGDEIMTMYPVNGRAKYLIDHLLIIGYNRIFCEKEVQRGKINSSLQCKTNSIAGMETFSPQLNESSVNYVPMKTLPVVLNEISSDCEKDTFELNQIISLIFPNGTKWYYGSRPPDGENGKHPNVTTVVFSNNYNDTSGRVCSCGFAYIFYERYSFYSRRNQEAKKEIFYIPKALCFISEFPYFSSYYTLAKDIVGSFRAKNQEVPMEIYLYNLVNYAISPLNAKISLNLFPILAYSQKNRENIEFPLLSGYPVIQINLEYLFSKVPMHLVIKCFFFSFLEKNILIFSENLEFLSLFTFVMSNFSYPLNDGEYYYMIGAISLSQFNSGDSKFGKKFFPTMYAINKAYSEEGVNDSNLNDYFVLDLDRSKFKLKNKKNPEFKSTYQLYKYVKKILKGKFVDQGLFLWKAMVRLQKSLEKIPKTQIFTRDTKDTKDPRDPTKDKNLFYQCNDSYSVKIQGCFYEFILEIVSNLYSHLSLNSIHDKGTNEKDINLCNDIFYIEYNEDYTGFIPEEKIFFDVFRETSKFKAYVYTTLQAHNPIDLYRIPIIIFDEMCMFSRDKGEVSPSVDYFDCINKLYENKICEDFRKIRETIDERSTISNRTFRSTSETIFYLSSNRSISPYINEKKNEQFNLLLMDDKFRGNNIILSQDDKQISSLKKEQQFDIDLNKITLSYDKVELNQRLLIFYNYFLQTHKDFLSNSKDCKIENLLSTNNNITLEIRKICRSQIEKQIELTLIERKCIAMEEIILYNIFLLFCATIELCNGKELLEQMTTFCELLQSRKLCLRRYFTMLLSIYLNLLEKNRKESDYKQSILMCFMSTMNIIRNTKMIPGGNMQELIKILTKKSRILDDKSKPKNKVESRSESTENFEVIETTESTDILDSTYLYHLRYNFTTKHTVKPAAYIRYVKDNPLENGYLTNERRVDMIEESTELRKTLQMESKMLEEISQERGSISRNLTKKVNLPKPEFWFKYKANPKIGVQIMRISTPYMIYEDLNIMLDNYLKSFDFEQIDTEVLFKYSVNLIFYVGYMEEFCEDKSIFISFLIKIMIMLKKEKINN